MKGMPEYVDVHRAEPIDGTCPHCNLPIYRSDPRRLLAVPPTAQLEVYHSGCAMSAEGAYWEAQLTNICQRLRGCGYIVELRIQRPVR